MAYVKVPAPSVVYHLTKADRLDSILDDGQIRRFGDSECWFCESLPKMKAYMEQTVMCEGKPYYAVGGQLCRYPKFVPEDYVLLKLAPCQPKDNWYRWDQEVPPGSPKELIKAAKEFSALKIGYRGDLWFSTVETIDVPAFLHGEIITMTGQYELIQVTKEVFQAYRRTKWNIEDSTERFFKHETQMSSLIGGENDGYERFHEFIDYDNTPENQAIEEMVFQSLHNVLELLPPKDYELIYELYFKNHTERECAQRLGMSQQAIHERKKRILKKIKNNLDEEGC